MNIEQIKLAVKQLKQQLEQNVKPHEIKEIAEVIPSNFSYSIRAIEQTFAEISEHLLLIEQLQEKVTKEYLTIYEPELQALIKKMIEQAKFCAEALYEFSQLDPEPKNDQRFFFELFPALDLIEDKIPLIRKNFGSFIYAVATLKQELEADKEKCKEEMEAKTIRSNQLTPLFDIFDPTVYFSSTMNLLTELEAYFLSVGDGQSINDWLEKLDDIRVAIASSTTLCIAAWNAMNAILPPVKSNRQDPAKYSAALENLSKELSGLSKDYVSLLSQNTNQNKGDRLNKDLAVWKLQISKLPQKIELVDSELKKMNQERKIWLAGEVMNPSKQGTLQINKLDNMLTERNDAIKNLRKIQVKLHDLQNLSIALRLAALYTDPKYVKPTGYETQDFMSLEYIIGDAVIDNLTTLTFINAPGVVEKLNELKMIFSDQKEDMLRINTIKSALFFIKQSLEDDVKVFTDLIDKQWPSAEECAQLAVKLATIEIEQEEKSADIKDEWAKSVTIQQTENKIGRKRSNTLTTLGTTATNILKKSAATIAFPKKSRPPISIDTYDTNTKHNSSSSQSDSSTVSSPLPVVSKPINRPSSQEESTITRAMTMPAISAKPKKANLEEDIKQWQEKRAEVWRKIENLNPQVQTVGNNLVNLLFDLENATIVIALYDREYKDYMGYIPPAYAASSFAQLSFGQAGAEADFLFSSDMAVNIIDNLLLLHGADRETARFNFYDYIKAPLNNKIHQLQGALSQQLNAHAEQIKERRRSAILNIATEKPEENDLRNLNSILKILESSDQSFNQAQFLKQTQQPDLNKVYFLFSSAQADEIIPKLNSIKEASAGKPVDISKPGIAKTIKELQSIKNMLETAVAKKIAPSPQPVPQVNSDAAKLAEILQKFKEGNYREIQSKIFVRQGTLMDPNKTYIVFSSPEAEVIIKNLNTIRQLSVGEKNPGSKKGVQDAVQILTEIQANLQPASESSTPANALQAADKPVKQQMPGFGGFE